MNKYLLLVFSLFTITITAQVKNNVLLGHWSDSVLVASTAHDNTYNEVWGHVLNDREYAIIGSTEGTHFIDVTDPSNLVEVSRVIGGTVGRSIIHRDYHNLGDYLYAVADEGGTSTLQIMDMSTLPDSVSLIYDSRELIRRSHNIFIDTSAARLYSLISGNSTDGFTPMAVYDITEPGDPKELGRYTNIDGFAVSQVHDGYIEDNIAFLNCGPGGFCIADFTDPENPELLSSFRVEDYPQGGYNHSGWASKDLSHYYMADENFGFDMKIFDVTDLNEARLVSTFNADSPVPNISIPHNQVVFGDYLYVSYYFDGVQIYDISDPANPVRAFQYQTSQFPHTNGLYRGCWGVYPFLPSGNILASDMQEGLFVISGVNAPVSNKEVTFEENLVYPNPSLGTLKVDIESDRPIQYQINNLQGERVQSGQVNGYNNIDLEDSLVNGIYIIRCQSEEKRFSSKFLLQR